MDTNTIKHHQLTSALGAQFLHGSDGNLAPTDQMSLGHGLATSTLSKHSFACLNEES